MAVAGEIEDIYQALGCFYATVLAYVGSGQSNPEKAARAAQMIGLLENATSQIKAFAGGCPAGTVQCGNFCCVVCPGDTQASQS